MPINLNKSNPNILLIQFRPAGDVLLLTPVVKAIKTKYTSSCVSFLVNEKESILLKDFKLIDNFLLVNKISKKGISNYFKYILYNFSIIKRIRRMKYDIVIDFIGNPKSAIITLLSKAPIRIGRNLGLRSIAYNAVVEKTDTNTNTVLRRLAHLKPIGIDTVYTAPEIILSRQDKKFGEDYVKSLNLAAKRKIIILAPNSPRSARRWKAQYFSFVGKALIKKYNPKILLAWGPGEEEYTQNIMTTIGSDAEMIPLTTLTEMAAIFAHSAMVITNESGAKHIANAVGVQTITIYGPTNPYVWNDIDMKKNPALRADVPCIQCEKRECPLEKHLCMEKLTPDKVLKIIDSILNNR